MIGLSSIPEKTLHSMYQHYRFSGEWFDVPEDVEQELLSHFTPIEKLNKKTNYCGIEEKLFETIISECSAHVKYFTLDKATDFDTKVMISVGTSSYIQLITENETYKKLIDLIKV